MKIRILLLSLICSLAAVTGVNAAEGKAKGGDKEETELGNHMDKMGGAMRKLKRQIADASKNEDSLKLVATIKAACVASLKLEPAWKSAKPAADQAKFVADFQAKMKDTCNQVVKMEAALKAGKNDEAAKICESIGQAQKDGHKEFKKPDEKKK